MTTNLAQLYYSLDAHLKPHKMGRITHRDLTTNLFVTTTTTGLLELKTSCLHIELHIHSYLLNCIAWPLIGH